MRKLLVFVIFLFPTIISADSDITLLFGGDIMAHDHNYNIKDFDDIWRDVNPIIQNADFAFANIEAPVDSTKPVSSFPKFNMSLGYLKAAVKAGFSVFSMCNNHSNDQGLEGIQETIRSCDELTLKYAKSGRSIYFVGLKRSPSDGFSYAMIEKNGWKILFFPVTESLNSFDSFKNINYISTDVQNRQRFAAYVKNLKNTLPCDLFIFSLHTNEPEYVRDVSDVQKKFYYDLIASGVDIVWANHAHLIKDRKIIIDTQNNTQKIIMYGNGNTISGQRRAPELTSKNPNGERDNTGDGLLYKVTFTKKSLDSKPEIAFAKPIFITTYINTANHFILRKLDDEFINYLYNVNRTDWAEYIKRRKSINEDYTKDLIEWR